MMSLNKVSFSQTVLKQVKWKVKAYCQTLITLIFIQIGLSILTSGGSITVGGGFNEVNLDIHYYSLDLNVIFTSIWALVTAIVIQTKGYRQNDYSVISTHFTASIANIIVLFIYSFIATIISFMTLYILVAAVQLLGNITIMKESTLIEFSHFGVVFFIFLFASALGYLIGSLFNLSKGLGILIVVFVLLLIESFDTQWETVLTFFFSTGYLSFMLKTLMVSILLFALAIFSLSRKEVNRQ